MSRLDLEYEPDIVHYNPFRAPRDEPTLQTRQSSYHRPSITWSPVSRAVSAASTRRGPRSSMSNEAVSPVSPISEQTYFSRPSTQSVDHVINSVSHEVSQYQANEPPPRKPLSPLMELSAHEAAFRSSIQFPSSVDSVLRSRAATIGSSSHRDYPRQNISRSSISVDVICNWLPISLSWHFLLSIFFLSIGLAALVLSLTIISEKNQGLGLIQNTNLFFFAWRFSPTIIGVIYTLFTAMIVRDIKRTEPYARLSKPDGASADASLFLKSRSFWHDIFDALSKKKNGGFQNWALFWATLVNLLGLLLIVPFSSALISPREIAVIKGANFSRILPTAGGPLELSTDDTILFQTISSTLLNINTSAWVSNDFTILPFWPSAASGQPSGALLSSSKEHWTAQTTVHQTGLECEAMTLQSFGNSTHAEKLPSSPTINAYELVNLTSFVLASEDACSLNLTSYPAGANLGNFFVTGGGWWSTSPDFSYPSLWNPGNGSVADLGAKSPIILNVSSECGDRSMFIFASSYQEGETFQGAGQICKSTYFSAELPVTITNDGSSSTFSFDNTQFNVSKTLTSSSILDIPTFEKAFLSNGWSSKFQALGATSNPTPAVRPPLGGPLVLLGAQYGFDIGNMMNASDLVGQAQQIKQRLFGHSLLSAFQQQSIGLVDGQVSVSEQRIMVSVPAGILIIASLLLSSLMIGLVSGYTRLRERPLNLLQDPSSIKALSSLISSGQNTRPLFEGLDTCTEATMRKQLSRQVFHLRHGILYSYDVRDAYQQPGNSSSGKHIGRQSKKELMLC